jgi:ribose-phosphate pyrophosphokinase
MATPLAPFQILGFDGMRNFHITVNSALYYGGEVRLESLILTEKDARIDLVIARIETTDDLMALAQLADVLMDTCGQMPALILPYMPYARQDRRIPDVLANQAFSLKIAANFINSMGWKRVIVCDPHSTVTPALLDRVTVIDRVACANHFLTKLAMEELDFNQTVFVSPDLGASKATDNIAAAFGSRPVLYGFKSRDAATGKLKPLTVTNAAEVTGKHVIVCDDICDGGGTFLGLASALRPYNPASLNLFVTHGIFSKGLDALLLEYNRIGCFNVFARYGMDAHPWAKPYDALAGIKELLSEYKPSPNSPIRGLYIQQPK